MTKLHIRQPVPVLMSFLLVSCLATPEWSADAQTYEAAIEATMVEDGIDRRLELRRCLTMWRAHAMHRRDLVSVVGKNGGNATDVLLLVEIGNSGFPRYDFVLLAGGALETSLKSSELSHTAIDALEERIRTVVSHSTGENLPGRASAGLHDGNCYFVSFNVNNQIRRAAIYGNIDESEPIHLIAELFKILENPIKVD